MQAKTSDVDFPRSCADIACLNSPANMVPFAQTNQLSYLPSVRFLPKKRSMRPITNLRSCFLRSKSSVNKYTSEDSAVVNKLQSIGGAMNCGGDIANRGYSIQIDESTRVDKKNADSKRFCRQSSSINVYPPSNLLTNASLYNVLHVLRDMTDKRPELCGFGVMGTDGIYSRIRDYKYHLTKRISSCPSSSGPYADVSGIPFYINKCYDSLDTIRLYDLLVNLIGIREQVDSNETVNLDESDNNNLIHKYSVCHFIPSLEKNVRFIS